MVDVEGATCVEQVEGLEAREHPEHVSRLRNGHVGTKKVLVCESLREMGHATRSILLLPPDGSFVCVRVELRHREQHSIDVAVLNVHLHSGAQAAAQMLTRVWICDLVVERRAAPPMLPRATVTGLQTMELVRSWGLTDAVLAGAEDVEWLLWVCTTLADAGTGTGYGVGVPSKTESALLSPTAPACVPQDHFERVLLERLRAMPDPRVEVGVELVALENSGNSVRATLRDVASNTLRRVHARYLVAADGVHGPVRGMLGIEQHGVDHLHESVSVLFHAPIWHIGGEHRYGIYGITHPEAAGTLLPAGGDRWIYAVEWDPDSEKVGNYTVDRLSRLIRLAIGDSSVEPGIANVGGVTFGAFMAERFREDSAFLIGDAAHRITPRGGTGMNLAIADGYDLGWKLAWVLLGWSNTALLDTYEAERRPPAEHNLERSMDPQGSRRPATDEVHVDLGGRLAHVWLPRTHGRTSSLDVLGRGLTLFTVAGTAWQHAAAELDAGIPIDVRLLDRFTARALGVRGPGALLARPDGVRVGSWFDDADAIDALRTATVRARCPSGSMPTFVSSGRATPVSPQHVA